MSDYLLGLDLGTSAVKCVLVDRAGRLAGQGSGAYPLLQPAPGRAEQDPTQWWQAVVTAVHAAVSRVPAGPNSVAAIGLSGQMHGTVLLDQAGMLLGNAVIWPDQRSARQVAEITDYIGAATLIDIAGSPVATGFMAATVRWLQQEAPDLWARVATLLLPKDWLRFRLTGKLATDPTDGAGALLLDIHRRDWSPDLLDALAIDPAIMPPVWPSTAVAGALTPDAAAQLGLAAGIPVIIGAADTPCSALGAGAVDAGTLLLTLSTGGQLVLPVEEPTVDRAGRVHTFCNVFDAGTGPSWYQMGAILSAGNALRWLRDHVFALTGEDAYGRMTAMAAAVPPGADGLLFLPYLAGERTPHMDPKARGAFLGLTLRHGRAEMARAVMEGVTLACFDAFHVLQELGASTQQVILAGGGAQSGLWRQMVADVFGLPVLPLSVSEQSAVGAALLAGAGAGLVDLSSTARAWATTDRPIEPNGDTHAEYRQLVVRFQAAYARQLDHRQED